MNELELKVTLVENGFVVCEKTDYNDVTVYKTWVFESSASLGKFMAEWAAEKLKKVKV